VDKAAGVLEADSPNAFGTGDVYVGAGGVTIAAASPVSIVGKYTQLAGTTLELDIDGKGAGQLHVGNQLTIAGGTLHVKLVNGYAPKAGDIIDLIDGNGATKQFTTIVEAVQIHHLDPRRDKVAHELLLSILARILASAPLP
jgi:hypothetical protein